MKKKLPDGAEKLVADNRKAGFEYEVLERYEAGLMLMGSEVKSLRDGKLQLADSFASIDRGEAFLHKAHIGEYKNAGYAAHETTRKRKLLLHKHEIEKLDSKVNIKGLTLIPLRVYFKHGRAKVELGLCRGKQAHDKRHSIKERDVRRETERTLSED